MNKMLFCNVAWMDFYDGVSNDIMIGGGTHIDTTGWGHEMYNFRPSGRKLYGYVRVSNNGQIKIDRLGANKNDDKIDNITIIWTAKHPETNGTYIVGWYKNATVFRKYQQPDKKLKRYEEDRPIGYCMITKTSDSKLLLRDERTIKVPRGAKGMGQSNIWYGDNNPDFVKKVSKYLLTGKFPVKSNPKKKKTPRQTDPLKRIEVERTAVTAVIDHYRQLGYDVESVERDNVGWDLNAYCGDISLKIEVKGLSGKKIAVELTPNELHHLEADKTNYRLCIVTNALSKPKLRVFSFSGETGKWSSKDGTILSFEEVISARVSSE